MGGIPSSVGGWLASEQWGEPYQQLGLRGVELRRCLLEREPAGAVDLGELLRAAGPRRPLDREGVAADRARVEVAGGRVRGDDLAALLAHVAELDEVRAVRQRRAQLL